MQNQRGLLSQGGLQSQPPPPAQAPDIHQLSQHAHPARCHRVFHRPLARLLPCLALLRCGPPTHRCFRLQSPIQGPVGPQATQLDALRVSPYAPKCRQTPRTTCGREIPSRPKGPKRVLDLPTGGIRGCRPLRRLRTQTCPWDRPSRCRKTYSRPIRGRHARPQRRNWRQGLCAECRGQGW